MSEMAAFEKFLDVLDQVITRAESIQSHSAGKDFGTGVILFRAEIHTIRAIGDNSGINITKLAESMGITKGAVSQTVNKLVRKKLVRKGSAPDNAKEVLLELTELGWTGYHNHEHFHTAMYDAVHEYYGDRLKPNLETLIKAFTDLNSVMDRFEQRERES
jgi:DNA-binding MarR family transcriptional regulator